MRSYYAASQDVTCSWGIFSLPPETACDWQSWATKHNVCWLHDPVSAEDSNPKTWSKDSDGAHRHRAVTYQTASRQSTHRSHGHGEGRGCAAVLMFFPGKAEYVRAVVSTFPAISDSDKSNISSITPDLNREHDSPTDLLKPGSPWL